MADDLFAFDMHDDGPTCEEEEDEAPCEEEQVWLLFACLSHTLLL